MTRRRMAEPGSRPIQLSTTQPARRTPHPVRALKFARWSSGRRIGRASDLFAPCLPPALRGPRKHGRWPASLRIPRQVFVISSPERDMGDECRPRGLHDHPVASSAWPKRRGSLGTVERSNLKPGTGMVRRQGLRTMLSFCVYSLRGEEPRKEAACITGFGRSVHEQIGFSAPC